LYSRLPAVGNFKPLEISSRWKFQAVGNFKPLEISSRWKLPALVIINWAGTLDLAPFAASYPAPTGTYHGV
jgi:hypothetical protein